MVCATEANKKQQIKSDIYANSYMFFPSQGH